MSMEHFCEVGVTESNDDVSVNVSVVAEIDCLHMLMEGVTSRKWLKMQRRCVYNINN
jgi:hypothetical protein